jgi:hypothetical protein
MSFSELHTLYTAFTKAGGHWCTFVIWGKNAFTLGRADYQRMFEPILYGWREGTRTIGSSRSIDPSNGGCVRCRARGPFPRLGP